MSKIIINNIKSYFRGWDDLRFPAQGINPPGAASDPVISSTTGLLEFSGSVNNIICGIAQMPHSWAKGTAVYPHLHLRFPTSQAANSRWKFEYDISDTDTPFINNYGTYSDGGTITIANPQNINQEILSSFNPILMTNLKESAIVTWKISRLAASDGADTDTSAIVLLEFDIHFLSNKVGTSEQIPT